MYLIKEHSITRLYKSFHAITLKDDWENAYFVLMDKLLRCALDTLLHYSTLDTIHYTGYIATLHTAERCPTGHFCLGNFTFLRTASFDLMRASWYVRGVNVTVHSWVTLLHSAAWGFSLSWAAAATKQLLSDAVFQNKQTDQVWWPPRPNCANAGVLKFGVVYSFSPLLAPWLLFFSLHFPFILSQLSNDVQIQLNL